MSAGSPAHSLTGRVALVVGGSGRIGRAVSGDLAARGARVAVGYRRSAESAGQIAGALGGVAVEIDTGDDAIIDAAFARVESELGAVEILVDAAHAESAPRPVAELDRAYLDSHLRAVPGFAALVRRAIPGMRGAAWGRVVYISGALMSRPHPGFAAYGAAKAAATTLTRYLALEEGRAGITANIVAPGRVFDPADELDDDRRALSDLLRERTALGGFPTTAEVAEAVGLLVSTPQLTGQTVWVTGGEPIIA